MNHYQRRSPWKQPVEPKPKRATGRPRLPVDQRRESCLIIPLTRAQLAKLHAAAVVEGIRLTTYARNHLIEWSDQAEAKDPDRFKAAYEQASQRIACQPKGANRPRRSKAEPSQSNES